MSSMLRVAAVVSSFPTSADPQSGMPLFNQMKAMARLTDLTVYVVRPRYPSIGFLQPRSFLHRRHDPHHRMAGLKVRYLSYPAFPVLSRGLNGRTCADQLLPYLRTERPDVILSYYIYPEGNAAVRAGERLGIPVVVGAVGSDIRRIPDALTRMLVKSTLREASCVVTKSRELREQAIRLGAHSDRAFAILNGCDGGVFRYAPRDAARAALGVRADAKLAVFTGRLVPVKGLPELIEAVAIVRSAGEPLELALIGDGPMAAELKSLCERHGVASAVRFLGMRGQDEVARWLAACNVFCLSSYSEGCPNVILEALCCGRPVVATDVGGVSEIVDSRCGMLVPPANPRALAAGLSAVLSRAWDEPEIARSYSRDWSTMAGETLQVCELAVTRNNACMENTGIPA